MPPASIDVIVSNTGHGLVRSWLTSGGSIAPTFGVKYRRGRVLHNFVYHTSDPSSCLQKYCRSIGIDMKDTEIVSPNRVANELDMSPNINPRFSKRGTAEVIVEYKRGAITHWFEFDDSLDSPRLQSYIEGLGLSVFDVTVTVLTVPEVDFLDL